MADHRPLTPSRSREIFERYGASLACGVFSETAGVEHLVLLAALLLELALLLGRGVLVLLVLRDCGQKQRVARSARECGGEWALRRGEGERGHAPRSFMFDSASVNSISSMPSPVYQ